MKTPALTILALLLASTSLIAQKAKRTHDEHMLRSVNSVFDIGVIDNDVTGNIWYKPHLRELTRSRRAIYLYFAKNGSIAHDLYLRLQYRAKSKMLVERFVLIIDGNEFEIHKEVSTGGSNPKGYRIGWIEIPMLEKHKPFLAAITEKSKIEIKMIAGRKFFSEEVTPIEAEVMYKVIDYYRLFEGKLPPG